MATSWGAQPKPAQGWLYNQVGMEYNDTEDPISSNEVFYNASGQATVWTAISKP